MQDSKYMQQEYQTLPIVDATEVRQTMARQSHEGIKKILQGINILLPQIKTQRDQDVFTQLEANNATWRVFLKKLTSSSIDLHYIARSIGLEAVSLVEQVQSSIRDSQNYL